MGKVDDAVVAGRKAVALAPQSMKAYNNLAAALAAKQDWAAAIDAYRHALAIDPKNAVVYSNLGDTLRQSGDLDGSVRCATATELDSTYASGFINLSAVLTDKGDFGGAAAVLNSAIKAIPRNADLYEHLGLDSAPQRRQRRGGGRLSEGHRDQPAPRKRQLGSVSC